MIRLARIAVTLLAGAGVAQQDDLVRVRVSVTSVAGRSVFVNRGSGAGLRVGSAIRLTATSGPIELIVRSVSSNHARAELPAGVAAPAIGTPGEVTVSRTNENVDAAPVRANPETVFEGSPWLDSRDDYDADKPLLAPVLGSKPEDRPAVWRGRVFSHVLSSRDRNLSPANEYFFGRVGTRISATNPLGNAGVFELALDADRRGVDLTDSGSGSDSRVRIERFSYTLGGASYSPRRVQFGRFYSTFVPEIGLLDGVEGAMRFEGPVTVGASVGALPRPFPSHDTGEDVAANVFVDYASPEQHALNWNVAYHKSWHHGDADRDLLLLRGSVRPADDFYVWLNAKVDAYTSGDTLKGSGVALTEGYATLRYAPEDSIGGSLAHTHFEWPQLDRREFELAPEELIREGRLDRTTAALWVPVFDGVEVRGRFDAWRDHVGDGRSWELGVTLDGVLHANNWTQLQVFEIDGTFHSGPGFGVESRQSFGSTDVQFGYRERDFEQRAFVTGPESFTSRSVRAGVAWVGRRWQLDLDADVFFGDREDTFSVGLFAQYSF